MLTRPTLVRPRLGPGRAAGDGGRPVRARSCRARSRSTIDRRFPLEEAAEAHRAAGGAGDDRVDGADPLSASRQVSPRRPTTGVAPDGARSRGRGIRHERAASRPLAGSPAGGVGARPAAGDEPTDDPLPARRPRWPPSSPPPRSGSQAPAAGRQALPAPYVSRALDAVLIPIDRGVREAVRARPRDRACWCSPRAGRHRRGATASCRATCWPSWTASGCRARPRWTRWSGTG